MRSQRSLGLGGAPGVGGSISPLHQDRRGAEQVRPALPNFFRGKHSSRDPLQGEVEAIAGDGSERCDRRIRAQLDSRLDCWCMQRPVFAIRGGHGPWLWTRGTTGQPSGRWVGWAESRARRRRRCGRGLTVHWTSMIKLRWRLNRRSWHGVDMEVLMAGGARRGGMEDARRAGGDGAGGGESWVGTSNSAVQLGAMAGRR